MQTEQNRQLKFEDLPQAMFQVLGELKEIKDELKVIKEAGEESSKASHVPVDIKRVSELTGLAVPTLYRYTSTGEIPCYKKGKSILFYEDEVMRWIRSGKCLSLDDRIAEAKGNIIRLERNGK